MKNRFNIFSLVLGLLTLLNVSAFAQPQNITITPDTITNTEVDTVQLGYVMDAKGDLYTLSYQITSTQLSGTTDLTVKHMVSNEFTGTNWVVSATDTVDLDGAETVLLEIADVPNARSALQITGSGTQSTRYTIQARMIRRD